MAAGGLPHSGGPDEQQARIDSAFRNGSITAISVVLGFSLSFLSRWAAVSGPWQTTDLVAVALIVVGIAFQIATLARMLSPNSLVLAIYDRAIRLFLIGLLFVTFGVFFAIAGDIVGYGQRILGA